jgi:hypothetical protein
MISIAHFDPRKHDKDVTNVLQPAPVSWAKVSWVCVLATICFKLRQDISL